jgi:hypothetical protein
MRVFYKHSHNNSAIAGSDEYPLPSLNYRYQIFYFSTYAIFIEIINVPRVKGSR